MDVKVEVGEAAELAQSPEQAMLANMQVPAYADAIAPEGVEARTSVPVLDDVMNADELEKITQEGLAANPEQTEAQTKEALEKAQQLEAYQNYLKQQHFFQFLSRRPMPATLQTVEWGLVKYLLICHEKQEFDHQPEIAALHEGQWYHGILTGNIAVFTQDDGTVNVALKRPYIGITTSVQYTPAEIAAQKLQQHQAMPRKQRRATELAQ